VGADLTHPWGLGSSIRASIPQGPPCHTWSLLSSGTRTRCCHLPQWFPMGYVQAGFITPLGNNGAPQARRGVSSWGRVGCFCCLWPLFVFWILRSPFQRLMLELELILLAGSVIIGSSHSTFQSILGTCGGP
uniref:Uncharacterized protein n=1 Tax=Catagonus wagneri TaxID=51154 RepID=A0A8C3YSD4_9CETA